jgi:hypothetical protein
VRCALLYLLAGFSLGALLLANKGAPFGPWVWSLLPAHIEFLLVGWTGQLILGVGFWILPRFPGGSRGNERLAWLAWGLLNAGVLLAAAQALRPGLAFLAPVGRLMEAFAAVAFAAHAWPRVRPMAR